MDEIKQDMKNLLKEIEAIYYNNIIFNRKNSADNIDIGI